MQARLALVAVLCVGALLSACGDREPVDHPAAPPSAAGQGSGESWWLLDSAEFKLVTGELTPEELANTTGSLWMLEYSNSTQSLRLVADRAGGLFSQLAAASPEVGRATIDGGVEAVLRQHPGRPEEGIAPSVGAEWTDNDVFVTFGGSGLTEPALRQLLSGIRRATRTEWDAAVATVPPPAVEETPTVPPASPAP